MFSPQTSNLATGLRCNQSVLCLICIFGAAGEVLNSTNRSTAVGVGLHVSSSFDVRIIVKVRDKGVKWKLWGLHSGKRVGHHPNILKYFTLKAREIDCAHVSTLTKFLHESWRKSHWKHDLEITFLLKTEATNYTVVTFFFCSVWKVWEVKHLPEV